MRTLGETVARLRELAGLERPDLEHLASLSRGHVWLIEHEVRKGIEATTAARIASVFGVTVDRLLDDTAPLPAREDVRAAVAEAWNRRGPRKGQTGTED